MKFDSATNCVTITYDIANWIYLNRNDCNDNGDDVGQHVVRITNERQRINDMTNDELHQEERQRQTEHRTQATYSSVHITRPPHLKAYTESGR